jgi:translation initiation factor IF-3
MNEDIRSKEMLVITEDGEKLGILSRKDALAEAEKRNLDLVLVSPQAKPQVAKIMDYSKYRFEQQKKAREQRKNQHVVQVQEIRMTPTIGDNDLITKANKARKILEKGNKIKVSVRFYGRLITRQDLGVQVLDKFIENLKDVAEVETQAKQEGKFLFTTLAPIKK